MYSVKHIIIHLNEYDIMSAREPESCLQISAERRMMITKAAASSKATNRDIINRNYVNKTIYIHCLERGIYEFRNVWIR